MSIAPASGVSRLAILAAALTAGCVAASTGRVAPASSERIARLRAETLRANIANRLVRGADVPPATSDEHGLATVCRLGVEIAPWYGVADARWELTRATTTLLLRPAPSLRDELSRIGVHGCVLDVVR